MKIYLGNSLVKEATENLKSSEVLFQSSYLVVSSSVKYMKIPIDSDSMVLIWGEVYALEGPNGTYRLFEDDKKGYSLLRELFQNCEINRIPENLEGNFVGVFIKESKKAVIFSDKFNRTEVFFIQKEDGAVVSTDLESVIQSVGSFHYSQTALANLLTIYGYYVPKKHTIYEEVHRLGVGEKLAFTPGKVEIFKSQFVPIPVREFGETEHEEYAKVLEDAVRIRSSDRCNWIFLSSGWDSTSLLALLVKIHGASKVHGVIGEMRYSGRAGVINPFEIERAQKFAEYYGVQLEVVPLDLTTKDSIDYWNSIKDPLKAQHIYSINAYNYSRLSDYVMEHGSPEDNVFAGEISDGIHNFGFSQYATILEHPDIGFREYSDKMACYLFGPTFFRSVLDGSYSDDAVYDFFRARVGPNYFDDATQMNESERRLSFFASFFLRRNRTPFYTSYDSKMLTRSGAENFEIELSQFYLSEAAKTATPETLYSWLLHLYNSFHWQGSTVRGLGARLEAVGRRVRFPFGDIHVHRFLSEMPENWGRGLEIRPVKYPLKRMLKNRINYPMHFQEGPHSYLYDVNPRFSHASEILFGSHLSNYFKEAVKDYPYEKLLDEKYFDLQYMRTLVEDYRKGVELEGAKRSDLMALVALCSVGWY